MRLVEGVADVEDVDGFVAWLSAVASETGVTVQAFDARYLVSRRHLERAVELADRAFERGENVARERGMEILLYAAGRRQIDQALELGVSAGRGPVVVLVDAADAADASARESRAAAAIEAELEAAPTLGDPDESRVRAYFDVTDAELAVVDGDLASLVLERVALLEVEK